MLRYGTVCVIAPKTNQFCTMKLQIQVFPCSRLRVFLCRDISRYSSLHVGTVQVYPALMLIICNKVWKTDARSAYARNVKDVIRFWNAFASTAHTVCTQNKVTKFVFIYFFDVFCDFFFVWEKMETWKALWHDFDFQVEITATKFYLNSRKCSTKSNRRDRSDQFSTRPEITRGSVERAISFWPIYIEFDVQIAISRSV